MRAGANSGTGEEASAKRAAEYVRMSTEHQRYSTENQAEAIRRYAEQRGLEIVRTYADQGKSGLNIGGRNGLRRLLADVASGEAGFSIVLVYDISRWGRFQDVDESGAYEFQCRSAGVRVEYCAEAFDNDGSIGSDIQKIVKRKMAGEYSRELSVKVFAGQRRLIELGFRQGGPAGFGLRRQLVDEHGRPKAILNFREHKSIQTDRVVLVPGPDDEVAVVADIYRDFVERGRTEGEIAARLNRDGTPAEHGRQWTRGAVHQILVNEKYAGHNVWNRASFKLKQHRVRNGPKLWVRAEGAFEAIVDPVLSDAARTIIRRRSARLTDDEMLDAMRRVLARHGCLSALLIDEEEGCPSSSAYQARFGSLLRTYSLLGYRPPRDYGYVDENRRLRDSHPAIMAETIARIRDAGGHVEAEGLASTVTVNHEFRVAIVLSRCRQTQAGARRWVIHLDEPGTVDITLAVRMEPGERTARDYYLFPSLDPAGPRLKLGDRNEVGLDAYRFDTLDALADLVRRVPLRDVA